jgi:acetyl esterase
MPLDSELATWCSQRRPATTGPPSAMPRYVVQRVADVQLRGPGGPLRARGYWPPRASSEPVPPLVVFFHAGGFVPVSASSADTLSRAVCSLAGVVVVSGAYRPTPDSRYPAAVQDAIATTEWAADHATDLGADPTRLVVAGEGFGGNLAAVVALHARDQMWPTLLRQVLVYPNLDARQESPSLAEHPETSMNSAVRMSSFYASYLRGAAAHNDPHVSPLLAPSVAGAASAMVITAEYDPIRDDGRRYAARLRGSGVETQELRYADQAHGTLALIGQVGGAERMLTDLVRAIRQSVRHLEGQSSAPIT